MLTARRLLVTFLGVMGAVAVAAIAPSVSAAAQRYADTDGFGSTCSAVSPCYVSEAISSAHKGDEIIVRPGDYKLNGTIGTPDQVTIHGIAGQPRPRLLFSGVGQLGLHIQFGSVLRYVEIDQAGASIALYAHNSSVDQVIARGVAGTVATAMIQNSTIRNSIVAASGPNARALLTQTETSALSSTYRNVTAVATGSGGVGVEAYALTGGNVSIDLADSIAVGGAGGSSLRTHTDSSGVQASITFSHSDYQSTSWIGVGSAFFNGGGNRTDAPAFVNAAAGDYRQAAGSHTINAGADDPLGGPVDVDGDPRRIGTTDMGADEFVPAPTATTGAADAVTAQSATLTGSVDGAGAPASYRFEYGTTSAYGSSTPAAAIAGGAGAVAASAAVAGLSPGTTYHYRVVAASSGGAAAGQDLTFTTAAAAVGQTGTGTPAASFAGVRLVSTRLTLARRLIRVRLTCPVGSAGRCTGLTKLSARRPPTATRAAVRVTLGRASFSIAPGQRATVRVRVSRAGRRLFAHTRRLRGRASNAAHDEAGGSRTTVAVVTIRRR